MINRSDSGSEKDLFDRIKLKDKYAYETFYKKHYKVFFALAYNYVKRSEIAEEIVNDVFINIWNKADEMNINQSVKSYVARSVVNASINFLKKEKLELEKQEKFSQLNFTEEDSDTDFEEKELLLIRLEKAVDQLPPQCKKVMLMSRFDKMKQQEIANSLNISIKTVKNHLTYGFAKIRETLAADGIVFCFVLISFFNRFQ